jgi:hypothetical protein
MYFFRQEMRTLLKLGMYGYGPFMVMVWWMLDCGLVWWQERDQLKHQPQNTDMQNIN